MMQYILALDQGTTNSKAALISRQGKIIASGSIERAVTVSGVDELIDDGNQTTPVTLSINDAASDDAFDGVSEFSARRQASHRSRAR